MKIGDLDKLPEFCYKYLCFWLEDICKIKSDIKISDPSVDFEYILPIPEQSPQHLKECNGVPFDCVIRCLKFYFMTILDGLNISGIMCIKNNNQWPLSKNCFLFDFDKIKVSSSSN